MLNYLKFMGILLKIYDRIIIIILIIIVVIII